MNGQKGLVPSNFLQAFPEKGDESAEPERTIANSRRDSQVGACVCVCVQDVHVTVCMCKCVAIKSPKYHMVTHVFLNTTSQHRKLLHNSMLFSILNSYLLLGIHITSHLLCLSLFMHVHGLVVVSVLCVCVYFCMLACRGTGEVCTLNSKSHADFIFGFPFIHNCPRCHPCASSLPKASKYTPRNFFNMYSTLSP